MPTHPVPKYCTFVREAWQSEFFPRVRGLLGWRIGRKGGDVVSTTYVGTRVNVCSQPDTHIGRNKREKTRSPPPLFFFLNHDISYFCWIQAHPFNQ